MWPQTLLWQTFLLIVVLMVLSVFVWYSLYRGYEREPHARQLAQLVESVINLTRSALVSAHPDKRKTLLFELSNREGIHIYPADRKEVITPLPDRPTLQLAAELLRKNLGPETRMTLERNGEKALFVSFRIAGEEENDNDEQRELDEADEYWIALPRERI
ncbi:MAG: two-component sensor histidine kinase, partial [Proteobacteria bacterium]|nr:two-component sensor histidine kinase [Pseudomonadota bacterium]